MYILPTPTHLEVVALGGSSDIFFFRHFNCELNSPKAAEAGAHRHRKAGSNLRPATGLLLGGNLT